MRHLQKQRPQRLKRLGGLCSLLKIFTVRCEMLLQLTFKAYNERAKVIVLRSTSVMVLWQVVSAGLLYQHAHPRPPHEILT